MNRLVIALICISLSACAHWQESPSVGTKVPPSVGTKASPPGLQGEAKAIREEYNCDEKKDLPFLIIESGKITPPSLQPGQAFNHTFVYAVCASDAQKPIKAALSRKIFSKEGTILQSVNNGFEVKPGRWIHTEKIKIPSETKPGDYTLQLSISIAKTTKTTNLLFVIRK